MLFDQLVQDGVKGKDLFWRTPLETTGRRKLMKKENLSFLPVRLFLFVTGNHSILLKGPFYKSEPWGERHGTRLMAKLKEFCSRYGLEIEDYTTAIIRKSVINLYSKRNYDKGKGFIIQEMNHIQL